MDIVISMSKVLKLCVLITLLVGVQATADCDFSDFPTMAEMKVSALMSDAQYNNRPMMVRSFSAGTSIDSVVGFYRRQWDDRYAESQFGPWQQISTLESDCFFTVQYAGAGEGAFGRLLISMVPESESNVELGVGVIKPGDALVVSDLLTDDGPKAGRVTVITSEQSVSELVNFYRTEMAMDSWSLEQSFSEGGGSVLVFRKGVDESNIVIMPAGDASQILINETEIN